MAASSLFPELKHWDWLKHCFCQLIFFHFLLRFKTSCVAGQVPLLHLCLDTWQWQNHIFNPISSPFSGFSLGPWAEKPMVWCPVHNIKEKGEVFAIILSQPMFTCFYTLGPTRYICYFGSSSLSGLTWHWWSWRHGRERKQQLPFFIFVT